MKFNRFIVFIVFLYTCITGFAQASRVLSISYDKLIQGTISNSTPQISVKQLALNLNKYVILDAREPKEYAVSHLSNAVNLGSDKIDFSTIKNVAKDQAIVVYCSIGYRSEKVSEKLMAMGFKKVYNLYGGIFEWKNQSQKVVNSSGETNEVHAYSKVWGVWLNKGKKVYN
jgi:rhodanese-related sulfurtransferase